jgi:hypothetical protein
VQIGDAKGYQTDALLHLARITVQHNIRELCRPLYALAWKPSVNRPVSGHGGTERSGPRPSPDSVAIWTAKLRRTDVAPRSTVKRHHRPRHRDLPG